MHLITLPQHDIRSFGYDTERGILSFTDFADGARPQLEIPIADVVGILAAPPCTMFSRARTTAKTPRDFAGAMEIVEACLRVVWICRSYGDLQFWALENPMGLLRQFLGNPTYSFQPWQFGDHHFKWTDLWGYFNKPSKKRGAKAPKGWNYIKWGNPKKPKAYAHLNLSRADIRAITPPHFAKAFYQANH